MRVGSLCTGVGGLDLAVGGELAWVCDNNPDAATVLTARYPNVPNLGDLTQLDEAPPVDLVTAGFPCQPVSTSGRRRGVDDERWIWDDILRVVGRMEPRPVVFLENVPGLLTANGGDAMARVVGGLAGLGFVGRWGVVAAGAVGACHRRRRVFVVAYPDGAGTGRHLGRLPSPVGGDGRAGDPVHAVGDAGRLLPTPTACLGRSPANGELRSARPGERSELIDGLARLLPTPLAADASHTRNATATRRPGYSYNKAVTLSDVAYANWWGDYTRAVIRHQQVLGRPPPDPTVPGRNGPVLNPPFVEWMMMFPEGWVTDLDLSRTAMLRLLGNAVVPPQATLAISELTHD